MSGIDAVIPRTAVKVNHLTRWAWGDDRSRVVRLAVLEQGDSLVGRVYGARGREIVLLQEAPVTSFEKSGRNWTVVTASGEIWNAGPGGCGCGSPLKSFDPLRVSP